MMSCQIVEVQIKSANDLEYIQPVWLLTLKQNTSLKNQSINCVNDQNIPET